MTLPVFLLILFHGLRQGPGVGGRVREAAVGAGALPHFIEMDRRGLARLVILFIGISGLGLALSVMLAEYPKAFLPL